MITKDLHMPKPFELGKNNFPKVGIYSNIHKDGIEPIE